MRARTMVEARHDRAPRPAAGPDGSCLRLAVLRQLAYFVTRSQTPLM